MYINDRQQTKNIVILSTNTDPKEDIGLSEITREHRSKGCLYVGYHYIIRRDGTVETGRPLDKCGNYRRSFNKNSVFVCLVGKKGKFTKEQDIVLPDIIDELIDLYPKAEVITKT